MTVSAGLDCLILVGMMVLGDLYETTIGYLVAATVHELGHYVAIRLAGGTVHTLRFGVCGGQMTYSGIRSYPGEIFASLAGAGANILTAYLLSLAGKHTGWEPFFILSGVNVMQGLFNLLPVRPLDGGEALYAFGCLLWSPMPAEALCRVIGGAVSIFLLGLGVYIFVKTRYNGTMLLCGGYLLLSSLQEWGLIPRLPQRNHVKSKG